MKNLEKHFDCSFEQKKKAINYLAEKYDAKHFKKHYNKLVGKCNSAILDFQKTPSLEGIKEIKSWVKEAEGFSDACLRCSKYTFISTKKTTNDLDRRQEAFRIKILNQNRTKELMGIHYSFSKLEEDLRSFLKNHPFAAKIKRNKIKKATIIGLTFLALMGILISLIS